MKQHTQELETVAPELMEKLEELIQLAVKKGLWEHPEVAAALDLLDKIRHHNIAE